MNFDALKAWARELKRDAVMLWFARNHPQTPLMAKILSIVTVTYALSPIDLIPDFIPILGYLDDLLIVPLLVWLTLRLLPELVIVDSRRRADEWLTAKQAKPRSYVGAAVIVLIWLAAGTLVWRSLGS